MLIYYATDGFLRLLRFARNDERKETLPKAFAEFESAEAYYDKAHNYKR